MSEEKTASKPMQLWNNALKAVKGDSTGQLVEQFTSEMTLVAEGLCEDQARLRKAVDDLRRDQDQAVQRVYSEQEALESTIRENQRDLDRRLDELTHRIAALEAKQQQKAKEPAKRDKNGMLQQLTVLASIIAGAWIIVTLLNLFK